MVRRLGYIEWIEGQDIHPSGSRCEALRRCCADSERIRRSTLTLSYTPQGSTLTQLLYIGTSRLFCLKPQLGTEGKGIEIVAASQLRQYAAQFFGANDQSVHPRYREYLAQHYINQPLLLGSKSRYPNRKFDFRVHAFAAMRIVERSGVLVPQFW